MDFDEMIRKAKELDERDKDLAAPYRKTIAWFCYLGLLRHSTIDPHRHTVTLAEALQAGALEPRIFELLPALLVVLPRALVFKEKDIPADLKEVVRAVRARRVGKNFRGIPPQKYRHWLNAPVMDIAMRRLDFRHLPRRRMNKAHAIGEVIKNGRLKLALTQKDLAEKYQLSLRVIRDLEQGKLDASLKTTNEILSVFGRSLSV